MTHTTTSTSKRKKTIKKRTIALMYHVLTEEEKQSYFTAENSRIDEDTLETVGEVQAVLRRKGYRIQKVPISTDDISKIQDIKADYIFNLADSKALEIKIARILERMHIPFSGSGSNAIQNGNNKIRAKGIMQKHAIPTPPSTFFYPGDKVTRSSLPGKFPLIVKPAFEHGSVGISDKSVITTFKQLQSVVRRIRKKLSQALVCETFIKGKEIHVMVLESRGSTHALPPAEMVYRGKRRSKWNVYGFAEKWNKNTYTYKNCVFTAPPKGISDSIINAIQRDAIRAFYAFGFRDYARFDIRYNPKTQKWYFLEGNPNPGLSSLPDDAGLASTVAAGMTFDEFILSIIHNSIPISPKK